MAGVALRVCPSRVMRFRSRGSSPFPCPNQLRRDPNCAHTLTPFGPPRRAGGLDNEGLDRQIASVSVMDRSLIALEGLEQQRDRLRAAAALAGIG